MNQRFLFVAITLFTIAAVTPTGKALAGEAAAGKINAAKAAPTHPGLERMKKMVGTWVAADKDGKPTSEVFSVVKITGAGSVVHETLFPGKPHEMVSMYHLDGKDLVMTHYCALGNQPRMKADPKSPAGKIRFHFAGGTNLDPARDKHMHDSTITFVDDDHIEIAGSCWEGGKPAEGPGCAMSLVRKK